MHNKGFRCTPGPSLYTCPTQLDKMHSKGFCCRNLNSRSQQESKVTYTEDDKNNEKLLSMQSVEEQAILSK